MLVKKELLSVPTLPAPKGKWQDKYIPAAQIVELPKSGRILAVDYYDKKELHARFFCDGKNYAVYSPKKATWGSGHPTSGSSGYYVHNVARVAETDSVCNSFFDARRGVDEVNSFIYQRNSQKRQTTCDNCKKHDDCASGSGLVWPCGAYAPKVVTNAEKIRSMTDQELAVFLSRDLKEPCDYCQLAVFEGACTETLCEDAMMKWLRQPAEGE